MTTDHARTTFRQVLSAAAAGALAAGLLAAASSPARADRPADEDRATYLGKTLYTGEFHSHTGVSDGAETQGDAFEHVHDETDADFFAVTEHDVMWDIRNGDDFIDDWREADSDEWRQMHEDVEAYNASQDELVAVPATENTWYDGTGHINLFNAQWHATARATEKGSIDGFASSFGTGDLKYDLPTYFARLKQDPEVIGQFNHPSTTSKGNFFGFTGLDPVVDERMQLIEVKSVNQIGQYQLALDAGWHLGPVWNGDEHSATWVNGNPSVTGVWATEHSLDGLYDAMRARSVYSTSDVNAELALGADGEMMGSVLPGDSGTVAFDVELDDPDSGEGWASVELVTNGGTVAHTFTGLAAADLDLGVDLPTDAGDFYYVKAFQTDGDYVVSAPVWIGETTRGADYAPVLEVADTVPATADVGQVVGLPAASATDDSGAPATVGFQVWDGAGLVPVEDGTFRIRSHDDHFVVVTATDALGNPNAELIRITVDQDDLDPEAVFQYFGTTSAVAADAGGAGIAVSTDRSIEKVYAQVLPEGSSDWAAAPVLTSTNDRPYEVNTIGNDEPVYQHSITGQTLRSHEFDIEGLTEGARYSYRLGVAVAGAAPTAADADAWTDVRGTFVSGGGEDEPVYVLGDLQVQSHDAADLGMLRDVLDRLESTAPGGRTAIQLGDLLDNGGRGQYWEEVHEHVFDGLDTQVAPVAGNHETYGDPDYNSVTGERTAIFSNMYDLPKNGAIGESNYSFDRGSVHFSVLNSNVDFVEQLDWLVDDVRSSDADWHVVMGHFSYYGGSHAMDSGMAVDRERITKVLDQLGVDLYLGAHDHVYKRSTVYDGRLAATPEEEAAGTTFVTMGSSGPKFYDNDQYWWDDVVFDEDTQMGGIVDVTDEGLRFTAQTVDGRVVDEYTVRKEVGTWRLSSAAVEDRQVAGVGLVSHEGSRDGVTVSVATYDAAGAMIDLRSVDVALDHRGSEQFVAFDTPLPVAPSNTAKVFVWDSLANGRPLRPARTIFEGLPGSGTDEDPYRIDSADDLAKVDNDPAGHYRLVADLDLAGRTLHQIGRLTEFTGDFDGAGHTISGFAAAPEEGAGLFADNHGSIHDLVVDGAVTEDGATAGILADLNNGRIERVRTSGSIEALNSVGGIVGDHRGVLLDSYSTADVHARGLYSGGVVGLARGGSTTANAYATGAVTAVTRNAGGLVSYGYAETAVAHSVSLNREVSAPGFAHAIVGRVADGQTAELDDNHVSSKVAVSGQSLADPPAPDNWKGGVVPAGEARTEAFFRARGWDFDEVWQWSEEGRRPQLRVVPEDIEPEPAPTLPTDERGFHVVDSVADLAQVGEFASYDFVLGADLDLSSTPFEPLAGPFVGELDGAGHTISGLTSTTGGLFTSIGGHVHDLGVVGADVTVAGARAGVLAATNVGTVERVWTSGTLTAASRAGGIVGDNGGVVRDAYSTVDVQVSATEAGGAVGVALAGSTTERVYATGTVASDTRNIGGVAGYGYTGTTIRDSVALNPSVTAPSYAHRFLGRVLAGNTATLDNNHAAASVVAASQSVVSVGATTLNGATASRAEVRSEEFYDDVLGWDLSSVWAWDVDGRRPVLRSVAEDVPALPVAPDLAQDVDGAYLIAEPADLAEVVAYPGEDYRLAGDLDLSGTTQRIGATLTGDLDGAGHRITGYTSTTGGLIALATGRIHDLTLVDATVDAAGGNVGLLVDRLEGRLDSVAVSGAITGASTVGGIVGYSCGTIEDSYTTAAVTADAGRQAGGVVGIAGGTAQCASGTPSTTRRTYAAGPVTVVGNQNAGGIGGYAYDGTTITHSVALGASVTATNYAHRIVARTLAAHVPTLADNHAVETLVAATQGVTDVGPATFNGGTLTVAQVGDPATWTTLGWDLDGVWSWDAGLGRPVLRGPGGAAPTQPVLATTVPREGASGLARPAPFAQVVSDGEGDGLRHTARVEDGAVVIEVASDPARAGEQVSVLLMAGDADPAAPTPADIDHLTEVVLDDLGGATLRVPLVPATLADRWLALNGSGSGERYVALLDGTDPIDPTDPLSPVTVGAVSLTQVYGRSAVVEVPVTAARGTATGTVTLRDGTRVLGRAAVTGGRARIVLPRRVLAPALAPHRLRADYSGDVATVAAAGEVSVRVLRGEVAMKVKAKKARVGRPGRVVVRVANADGVPVTGRVTVRLAGRGAVSARVVGGRARVVVPRVWAPGSRRLTVRYTGSTTLRGDKVVTRYRVRR